MPAGVGIVGWVVVDVPAQVLMPPCFKHARACVCARENDPSVQTAVVPAGAFAAEPLVRGIGTGAGSGAAIADVVVAAPIQVLTPPCFEQARAWVLASE